MAFINIIISGLPLLVILHPIVFLIYCGICVIFILLFCWNSLGDSLIVIHSCHARILENDDLIFPIIHKYNDFLRNKSFVANENVHYFYTDSQTPYWFSISKNTIIFSRILENSILDNGVNFFESISDKSYESKLLLSRKVVLLSVLCYNFIFFIMKIWMVFFSFAIKFMFSLVMVLVTGALFERPRDVLNAVHIGAFMGEIALFVNKVMCFIQDKMISFVMKKTCNDTLNFVENKNTINTEL